MTETEAISLFKCLADKSRLQILKSLAMEDMYVERLAERLGIPMGKVAAFGDGTNDLSMIRAAGMGVAMGNAAEEVKAAADRVTAGNGEDGVGIAVETLTKEKFW